jgi:hypothetical protein
MERSPQQLQVDYEIRKAFLFDLWLWKLGMSERDVFVPKDINKLRESEWSPVYENAFKKVSELFYEEEFDESLFRGFIQFQKNRLVMGAYRYGYLGDPDKPKWDRLVAIEKYFAKYMESGNAEMLIDVSNYCLLEYVEGENVSAPEILEERMVWGITGKLKDYQWALDRCLIDYRDTRNREHLVLGSMFVFGMYLHKMHPNHHFEGSDNTSLHCGLKL